MSSNQNIPYSDPGWRGPDHYNRDASQRVPDEQEWVPTYQSSTPPPPPPPLSGNPYTAQDPYSSYGPPQGSTGQGWDPYSSQNSLRLNDRPVSQLQPPMPVPVRRHSPWIWVTLFLLVLIISGVAGASYFIYKSVTATQSYFTNTMQQYNNSLGTTLGTSTSASPTIIPVGSHPTIILDSSLGAIQVRTGSSNTQVSIQALSQTKTPIGPLNYTRSSDGRMITINVSIELDPSEIDLVVPKTTDLKLNTTVDGITVTGVSGQMSLTTNTGPITLSQDTLNGLSIVNADSDQINATQVSLSGQVSFKTNIGSLTFSGTLDPKGTYHFETNTGDLDITLPLKSSFHLDVSTNTGTTATDFPGLQNAFSNVSFSNDGHGDVGNSPRATVKLKTNTGAITLHKG